MSFFDKIFGGTSVTTSPPSVKTERTSVSGSTGSVGVTTPHGSGVSYSGPNFSVDFPGGGAVNPTGTGRATFALNQDTSVGVGVSPFSRSSTIERSSSNGVSESTFNIPFTPFSLFKTSYSTGTSPWAKTSKKQEQQHLHNLVTESRQMELQSLEKMQKMMSPSDYERQRAEIINKPFPGN